MGAVVQVGVQPTGCSASGFQRTNRPEGPKVGVLSPRTSRCRRLLRRIGHRGPPTRRGLGDRRTPEAPSGIPWRVAIAPTARRRALRAAILWSLTSRHRREHPSARLTRNAVPADVLTPLSVREAPLTTTSMKDPWRIPATDDDGYDALMPVNLARRCVRLGGIERGATVLGSFAGRGARCWLRSKSAPTPSGSTSATSARRPGPPRGDCWPLQQTADGPAGRAGRCAGRVDERNLKAIDP